MENLGAMLIIAGLSAFFIVSEFVYAFSASTASAMGTRTVGVAMFSVGLALLLV